MNKKLKEYKNKINRIIKTFKAIGILILFLGILISIVKYNINKSETVNKNQTLSENESDYLINLNDNSVVYSKEMNIEVKIKDFEESDIYNIELYINENKVIDMQHIEQIFKYNLNLENEGKNDIKIIIYKNYNKNFEKTVNVYYIEEYQKQFLDEQENLRYGNPFEVGKL